MKSVSFILLTVLCLVACMGTDNSRPDSVIPMDKMASILADIHLTEGIIATKEFPKDTSLLLFSELENQLLEKRGVTKEQFKESYDWYTGHVEVYKELYTHVVDTLNVRTNNSDTTASSK
ncbi:MAG: hypothetical protein JWO58_2274 [Chitinophagaceae bacterium]|nr:hypothetical protein [Chitinophagaceae bacterium]